MVNETAKQGLDGFSQMAGIPGTIGGALRMNADAAPAMARHLRSHIVAT